jgi:DNA polymerase-3 subunit gamma/tau
VRAGAGSVRDTLSLLDQLIAGSESNVVEYERAVALLGYTHGALLDEIVNAIGARDAAAVFAAVDRVIQTGQDPRRFVEDLLERLRDLIIVSATSGNARSALRGVPQDQLDRMIQQASTFGPAGLSRSADIVNAALSEMTGATSPRLHLELMVARILVPASDDSQRGALARVERLERRVGMEQIEPAAMPSATRAEPVEPAVSGVPAESAVSAEPVEPAESAEPVEPAVSAEPSEPAVRANTKSSPPQAPASPVTLQQLKDAWPEILEFVQRAKMSAWTVVYTAKVRALDGDVLSLAFVSQNDVDSFKQPQGSGEGISEYLRKAIVEILGLRVKFTARVEGPEAETVAPKKAVVPENGQTPAPDAAGWAVASIPESEPALPAPAKAAPRSKRPSVSLVEPDPATDEPRAAEPDPAKDVATTASPTSRYGESVVRELLGASFVEEHDLAPRVVPVSKDQ